MVPSFSNAPFRGICCFYVPYFSDYFNGRKIALKPRRGRAACLLRRVEPWNDFHVKFFISGAVCTVDLANIFHRMDMFSFVRPHFIYLSFQGKQTPGRFFINTGPCASAVNIFYP